MFCKYCGNELVSNDADVCTRCGKLVEKSPSEYIDRGTTQMQRRSTRAWYLLPLLMGFIGGVIAYFILRSEDVILAKNCLILGIIWSVSWFMVSFISMGFFGMMHRV